MKSIPLNIVSTDVSHAVDPDEREKKSRQRSDHRDRPRSVHGTSCCWHSCLPVSFPRRVIADHVTDAPKFVKKNERVNVPWNVLFIDTTVTISFPQIGPRLAHLVPLGAPSACEARAPSSSRPNHSAHRPRLLNSFQTSSPPIIGGFSDIIHQWQRSIYIYHDVFIYPRQLPITRNIISSKDVDVDLSSLLSYFIITLDRELCVTFKVNTSNTKRWYDT